LIAEDVESYVKEIEKCLNTHGLIKELGQNAWEMVIKNHNNDGLMQKLSEFYLSIKH
jgi:hypothetical protein